MIKIDKIYPTKDGIIGLLFNGNEIILRKNDVFKYHNNTYKMVNSFSYMPHETITDKIKKIFGWIKIIKFW